MGESKVFCLVSKDHEAYTYNHKVNRLNPIQEHYMIMKAIEFGVSEDRISKALNVDVARIKQKRNMIKGLCAEADELLKDRIISPAALALLKKVKPFRQIEIADLMIGVHNFSVNYAKAMVAATPESDLVEQEKPKTAEGISLVNLNRMRKEMETLGKDFRLIEESYGRNMLDLTLARGYLGKILDNGKVVRFLSSRHPDILAEFSKIVESSSLAY